MKLLEGPISRFFQFQSLGCENAEVPQTYRIAPIPKTVEYAKDMFGLVVAERAISSLPAWLEKKGFKFANRAFTTEEVRSVLISTLFIGASGKCEATVDEELFNEVQSILSKL